GGVLVGFLAVVNVQDRIGDIGILRALGVGTRQVFGLFLAKAVIAGAIGGLLGYALGTVASLWLGETSAEGWAKVAFSGTMLAGALLAAPLLCALASLLPAVRAARQDPALILPQE